MGLIGLIATVVIMVLGAGYYFFSVPGAPVTFTNTNEAPVPVAGGMALYEDLKTQATDIKDTEEERVEKEIAEREAALAVETPTSGAMETSDTKTTDEAGIVDRLMTSGFPCRTRHVLSIPSCSILPIIRTVARLTLYRRW